MKNMKKMKNENKMREEKMIQQDLIKKENLKILTQLRKTEENTEREHLYKDINGDDYIKLVVRKSGERFGTMHYNPESGKYENGMGEYNPIPYRLKELKENKDNLVFITNGEKDADTLIELGYSATTAITSSPYRWKKEYNKWLEEKNVVILQDNTEIARKFAKYTRNNICYFVHKYGIAETEKIAEKLKVKVKYNMDITTIREKCNNDSKIIEVLEHIRKEINKR